MLGSFGRRVLWRVWASGNADGVAHATFVSDSLVDNAAIGPPTPRAAETPLWGIPGVSPATSTASPLAAVDRSGVVALVPPPPEVQHRCGVCVVEWDVVADLIDAVDPLDKPATAFERLLHAVFPARVDAMWMFLRWGVNWDVVDAWFTAKLDAVKRRRAAEAAGLTGRLRRPRDGVSGGDDSDEERGSDGDASHDSDLDSESGAREDKLAVSLRRLPAAVGVRTSTPVPRIVIPDVTVVM